VSVAGAPWHAEAEQLAFEIAGALLAVAAGAVGTATTVSDGLASKPPERLTTASPNNKGTTATPSQRTAELGASFVKEHLDHPAESNFLYCRKKECT